MLAIAPRADGPPPPPPADEPSLSWRLIVRQIFDQKQCRLTVFLVEQNAFHASSSRTGYVMVNGSITLATGRAGAAGVAGLQTAGAEDSMDLIPIPPMSTRSAPLLVTVA